MTAVEVEVEDLEINFGLAGHVFVILLVFNTEF